MVASCVFELSSVQKCDENIKLSASKGISKERPSNTYYPFDMLSSDVLLHLNKPDVCTTIIKRMALECLMRAKCADNHLHGEVSLCDDKKGVRTKMTECVWHETCLRLVMPVETEEKKNYAQCYFM